jgi:hypothetical protein
VELSTEITRSEGRLVPSTVNVLVDEAVPSHVIRDASELVLNEMLCEKKALNVRQIIKTIIVLI